MAEEMSAEDRRRSSMNEFAELLKESNRDIQWVVREQLSAAREEATKRAGELRGKIELNKQAMDNMAEVVRDVPRQLGAIEADIANIKDENKTQWAHITDAKDSVRSLDVRIAALPGEIAGLIQQPPGRAAPDEKNGVPWMLNKRVQIILACAFFVFIAGLLILAGADLSGIGKMMK